MVLHLTIISVIKDILVAVMQWKLYMRIKKHTHSKGCINELVNLQKQNEIKMQMKQNAVAMMRMRWNKWPTTNIYKVLLQHKL